MVSAAKTSPAPTQGIATPVFNSRDRNTLEVRQFYPKLGTSEDPARYSLSVYFFFPRGSGIDEESWGSEGFYRDSRLLLRLHSPTRLAAEITNLANPSSPLAMLHSEMAHILEAHNVSGARMVALARIVGAELSDAFLGQVEDLDRAARIGEISAEALEAQVHEVCKEGLASLAAVRAARRQACMYRGVAHPALESSLEFAEEYASMVLSDSLAGLALMLQRNGELRQGSGAAVRTRLEIARTLARLYEIGRQQGFSVPDRSDPEYFNYRLGRIKKELQASLYVSSRSSGRDPFISNSAAMVAAGLAATWATLAQLPLLSVGLWSTRGLIFLGAAVGAYVLKDRIKEVVRKRLARRWLQWDHDNRLGASTEAWVGQLVGREQERLRWHTSGDLPPDVIGLRREQRTVRGSSISSEEVVHYHQRMEIGRPTESSVPSDYGVQQILRLSLNEMIHHLDEPEQRVRVYARGEGFGERRFPKVYHLNVVAIACNESTGERRSNRSRVVLSREGILRIEKIAIR